MNNKEIMSKNLRRYMDEKNVSNLDVCNALGIKYTTFLDWVNAKTYPRIGKIELLANYFGVQKSDLIEEKLTEEKSKQNDLIASVVIRMRTDQQFAAAVEKLYNMDAEKVAGVSAMLAAFEK